MKQKRTSSSTAPLLRWWAAVWLTLMVLTMLFHAQIAIHDTAIKTVEFLTANCALLLLWWWLAPHRLRGLSLLLTWATAIFLWANGMHHRYWSDLLAFTSIFSTASFNGFVLRAVPGLLRWADLLYVAIPLPLTLWWWRQRRGRNFRLAAPSWRLRLWAMALTVGYFFAANVALAWHDSRYYHSVGIDEMTPEATLRSRWSFESTARFYTYSRVGLPAYVVWQAAQLLQPHYITLSADESAEIRSYLATRRPVAPGFERNRGKNLIFILVESLNADCIGQRVRGRDITPTLSSLLSAPGTISALRLVPQIKDGGSSDGKMIYNTGLLPLATGAAAVLYGDDSFPSLAASLTGYNSVEILGGAKGVWNHVTTSRSYGYERTLDSADMLAAGFDPAKRGTDAALLDYSARVLQEMKEPFVTMISTVSMHYPCQEEGMENRYHISATDFPEMLPRNYYISLSYFDHCLGSFLHQLDQSGLLSRSIVVIASDHDQTLTRQAVSEMTLADHPIAFIATNTGRTQRIERVGGQVDVFPTLLEIMGRTNARWRGLGTSLLSPAAIGAAVDCHDTLHGTCTPAQADTLRLQWRIADRLIRSNFSN
jgi:hypothetical protein